MTIESQPMRHANRKSRSTLDDECSRHRGPLVHGVGVWQQRPKFLVTLRSVRVSGDCCRAAIVRIYSITAIIPKNHQG